MAAVNDRGSNIEHQPCWVQKGYNLVMIRAALLALLVASLPAQLLAQRMGAISSARGGISVHSNSGGHNFGGGGRARGFVGVRESGRFRHQRYGYVAGDFPYYLPDYESGWPEADNGEVTNEAPLVRVHDESSMREPERPLPAQVIEIPNVSKSRENRPLPPTIFVLTTGEKLETQRYLLTASSLSVTVQRSQRTIPIQMLDYDATVAANRDRGVDVRIPNDRNEI